MGATPSWGVEDRDVFDSSVGNPTTDLGPISKDNVVVVNTKDGQPADLSVANGYNFEMRIPWNIHRSTDKVTAGQRIRWHMYANNSRELPSNQDMAMSPSGRANFNRNPAAWYREMLDPKP